MSRILSTWAPKVTTGACIIIIFAILADTYIVGGLKYGSISVSAVLAINTRAVPIVALVMVYSLLLLYWRRLTGNDPYMRRKGLSFFVALASILIVGLGFGVLSAPYTIMSRAIVQLAGDAGSFWIAVTFVSLMCRGYMVKSKEGLIMASVGILELYGQGAIGWLFGAPIGDLGIWLMRFPSIGANNAMWFTTYIALISVVGRIVVGKQKLRAAR